MTPYGIQIPLPPSLHMTGIGTENIQRRARERAQLRRLARDAFRHARLGRDMKASRYTLLCAINTADSPIVNVETFKPLIDAGTDTGAWPDDDPRHRTLTIHATSHTPGPLTATMIVMPHLENPMHTILDRLGNPKGTGTTLRIPDRQWLTSNMRLPAPERLARQQATMMQTMREWPDESVGRSCVTLIRVRYPHPDYPGDPDNTAESVAAAWAGIVRRRLAPSQPEAFIFQLDDTRTSPPGTHELDMTAWTCPKRVNWTRLLLQ